MKILICGASIAGPAAAFWLARAGHDVTVVERAKAIRRGGYAVDIRGAALTVVERMGLREALRPHETDTEANYLVDARGRRFGRMARGFGVIDPNDVELLRGDLASILYDATRGLADYRFGDTLTSLREAGSGVEVTLASGATETYDLVVGADGIHSRVRALAFGPESDFVRDLGSAMAIGTLPNHLGLVREQLSYNDVRRVGTVKSADHDRELKVCLFFPMTREAFDPDDGELQRRQVREAFAAAGWELPTLAERVTLAEDFYADLTCQIRMDRHCTERVALVGDAGYGPSPLAGQGTSLALVGAYLLAAELGARTDPPLALSRYDAAMTPFARKNQDLALKLAGGFAPSSKLELAVRNAVMRVLPWVPGTSWIVSKAMGGVRVAAEAITLPAEPAPSEVPGADSGVVIRNQIDQPQTA